MSCVPRILPSGPGLWAPPAPLTLPGLAGCHRPKNSSAALSSRPPHPFPDALPLFDLYKGAAERRAIGKCNIHVGAGPLDLAYVHLNAGVLVGGTASFAGVGMIFRVYRGLRRG